ncbi:hypothetical protein K1T71_013028 [Dendrolimus kikuchii]|uniref:Uncharacterized protein n=1 Tax=Dendrolimus kikuchii TaxID=765133 RepID=A0ACC1CIW4_9NEOP|nr:hypothetical protein K1T71_013028 [Dendrolimus kikuchii]
MIIVKKCITTRMLEETRRINLEFDESLPKNPVPGLFEPRFENVGQLRFKKVNKPLQAPNKLSRVNAKNYDGILKLDDNRRNIVSNIFGIFRSFISNVITTKPTNSKTPIRFKKVGNKRNAKTKDIRTTYADNNLMEGGIEDDLGENTKELFSSLALIFG